MIVVNIEGGAPAQSPKAPLSIALGNFDGVHLGHAELIRRVLSDAAAHGRTSAVWTFSSNPLGSPCITSIDEKLEMFEQMGVEYAVVCSFEQIKDMSPDAFADLLVELKVEMCVCGYNYTFGKGASGNADDLRALMEKRGIECAVCPPFVADGDDEPVSSTRIRRCLAAGEVEEAARLLGRPYSFTYPVTHGNEIGRTLGFPTINQLLPADRVVLKNGVYVCRCLDGPAVTNVGTRPTVCDGDELVCETHIIDYRGDLYGKPVRVEFLSFIREEKKFASLDELKERLALDVQTARNSEFFGE